MGTRHIRGRGFRTKAIRGEAIGSHQKRKAPAKRGKHIQVGLLLADHSRPALPMDMVLSKELEIIGSHGMQAHRYPAMLEMIRSGALQPRKLLGRTISLQESIAALPNIDRNRSLGVTVINSF